MLTDILTLASLPVSGGRSMWRRHNIMYPSPCLSWLHISRFVVPLFTARRSLCLSNTTTCTPTSPAWLTIVPLNGSLLISYDAFRDVLHLRNARSLRRNTTTPLRVSLVRPSTFPGTASRASCRATSSPRVLRDACRIAGLICARKPVFSSSSIPHRESDFCSEPEYTSPGPSTLDGNTEDMIYADIIKLMPHISEVR